MIRPAVADDIPFIMSSWKRSWRVSPWAGTVRNDDYFAIITHTIEGLVARGAVFNVCCASEDTSRILGWVCYEHLPGGEACVHYLYVKDPFLRMGIGEKLVESVPGTKPGCFTHRFTQVAEACQGWRHSPHIARIRVADSGRFPVGAEGNPSFRSALRADSEAGHTGDVLLPKVG